MLVLTRRLKEKIVFPSINTEIQVLGLKGGQVRLGIEAPPQVAVLREELAGQREDWNGNETEPRLASAGSSSLREFGHLVRNRLNDIGLNLAVLRQQLDQAQADPAHSAISRNSTISRIEEDLKKLRHELEAEFARFGAGRLEEAHTTA
jgi:carbon storage regulator CsrA